MHTRYVNRVGADRGLAWKRRSQAPVPIILDIQLRLIVSLGILGGAYVTPLKPSALNFYMYLQRELEKSGRKVGIAVLSYSECLPF